MDSSKTWDSGAKIGYQALQDLSAKDVYVAKLGYTSARAATTWEDAYRILALSLSNIANDVPNSPAEACNLTLKSMAATKTWDSGAKVGYAALEFIGTTDNADVRNFVKLIYNSAKAARTWEDAHKTIANGLTEMKNMF